MADHVYISPHLDDAIYSCGGLIYQQASRGEEVIVVTVFGGDSQGPQLSPFAQKLHTRWGMDESAVDVRKEEDRRACALLGARAIHLPITEAIYRIGENGEHYYASEEAIFGEICVEEIDLIEQISSMLVKECGSVSRIYAPVGYGGHVDHRLTRKAVDRLGRNVCFYRDFPYAMREGQIPSDLNVPEGKELLIHLSEDEIVRWAKAVKEYRSQISTFWSDPDKVEEELAEAHRILGGIPLICTI